MTPPCPGTPREGWTRHTRYAKTIVEGSSDCTRFPGLPGYQLLRYHVLRPAVNLGKPNFKVAVAVRRITSSQFPSKTGVGSVFFLLKMACFASFM